MGRQQILINTFFVLLGFLVSGGLKHLFNNNNKSNHVGVVVESGGGNDDEKEEEINNSIDPMSTINAEEIMVSPPSSSWRPQQRRPDDDGQQQVQFVYFMGLEGSGHEYLHKISMESPMIKQYLQELDSNIYPNDIQVIQNSLLDKEYGLWSAYFNAKPAETLNLTETRTNLVETLSNINHKITSSKINNNNNKQRYYYIPINVLNSNSSLFGDYGRVRYLNLKEKNIRMIEYPTIDIFYDACDEANVDCRHIYLYRNPYELLHKSTAPHVLEAMHTSISMLLIIASQMRIHSDRTLGCWDLFSGNDGNNTMNEMLMKGLATIFGWNDEDDDDDKLSKVLKDNYIPLRIDDSFTKVSDIVPTMNQNYFDSMMKSHKMVLEVCNQ